MFGDPGQPGYLVQKLAGVEPVIDIVPRLRLKALMEIVQDPEVTANIATHNLVQVLLRYNIYWFLRVHTLRCQISVESKQQCRWEIIMKFNRHVGPNNHVGRNFFNGVFNV